MDWNEGSFVLELVYLGSTIPFFYFTWASGYMGMLMDRAWKNRWGLTLLDERRWPRRRIRRNTEWDLPDDV